MKQTQEATETIAAEIEAQAMRHNINISVTTDDEPIEGEEMQRRDIVRARTYVEIDGETKEYGFDYRIESETSPAVLLNEVAEQIQDIKNEVLGEVTEPIDD